MGDVINCPGQDFDSMPVHLFAGKSNITSVDLSFNNIRKVDSIEGLTSLVTLVLDNNMIGSKNTFPHLPSLRTLSLNNNNIDDLKSFIESIKDKFPNLTHLSLLKNPACPSYYVTGSDFDDYQKYRYFVLFHMKHLKFLDFSEASPEEKKEAARLGVYSLIARPTAQDIPQQPIEDEEEQQYKSLSPELAEDGKGKSSFGLSNYVYYGKQSEGNRFIMNDDL
eukprot:gene19916-23869_t